MTDKNAQDVATHRTQRIFQPAADKTLNAPRAHLVQRGWTHGARPPHAVALVQPGLTQNKAGDPQKQPEATRRGVGNHHFYERRKRNHSELYTEQKYGAQDKFQFLSLAQTWRMLAHNHPLVCRAGCTARGMLHEDSRGGAIVFRP